MVFKIISFNVHRLNHPAKRALVWREALKLQDDVLCIQETHFLTFNTPHFYHKKISCIFLASAPTKQKRVLIAIKDSIAFNLPETQVNPEGHYLILIGELNNKPFTIVKLYSDNSNQIRFLKKLFRRIATTQRGSLVITGDYNSTTDFTIDTTSKSKRPLPRLQPLLHSEDVYDVCRCQHSNKWDYTFHSSRHKTYSRINMILVDKMLLQALFSSTIHNIYISITVGGNTPIPAYMWHANSCTLQMPSHAATITKNVTELYSLNNHSVSESAMLWYAHKAFIGRIIPQICPQEKRQRTQKLDRLLGEIKAIESLNKKTADTLIANKLFKLRSDLRLLLIEQYDKHFNALNLSHYLSGNRAGKFLAQRLKVCRNKTKIPYLIHSADNKKYSTQKT